MVVKEPIYGVRGWTCTCGADRVNGIMCRHVVAIAKSGRGNGLNLVNGILPEWTTEQWRAQFPQDVNSRSCPTIDAIKDKYEPDRSVCFLPDFVAPRKKGRPKKNQRIKSGLEIALSKSRGEKQKKTKKNEAELAMDGEKEVEGEEKIASAEDVTK